MKTLFILIFSVSTFCFAQKETIYTVNGSSIEGRIVSVEGGEDGKVKTVIDGGKLYYGGRDKILIAFNKIGNYITIRDISTDDVQAQKQIDSFYSESLDNIKINDVLIKAIPQEIIACTISNELEEVINYVTIDGKPASINKNNLIGIIRKNGSHWLNPDKEIAEIVDNLSQMTADFRRLRIQKKIESPVLTQTTSQPTKPIPTEPAPKPTPKERYQLTSEEQKIAKAKSIDKMEDLRGYLNDIVDKNRSPKEKNEAIEKAVKMFTKEATVEVSSINNPTLKVKRSVKDYLTRLSALSYSKVTITYADIKFVQDFERDEQGNYWGIASYVQTFLTDRFTDMTPKRQKVKLQPYEKIVEGVKLEKYDILLGDIQVEQNR